MEFLDHPALIALLIFLARVTDVSLGTLRSILVFRGFKLQAAVTGFFEILVWIAAAGKVLNNLDEWYLVVAYAAGFAAGNYVGIWIESKIAMGAELVRAVSATGDVNLADELRRADWSVTELAATTDGEKPVEVLLIVERRKRINRLLRFIERTDPHAIWTTSDVKLPTPSRKQEPAVRP